MPKRSRVAVSPRHQLEPKPSDGDDSVLREESSVQTTSKRKVKAEKCSDESSSQGILHINTDEEESSSNDVRFFKDSATYNTTGVKSVSQGKHITNKGTKNSSVNHEKRKGGTIKGQNQSWLHDESRSPGHTDESLNDEKESGSRSKGHYDDRASFPKMIKVEDFCKEAEEENLPSFQNVLLVPEDVISSENDWDESDRGEIRTDSEERQNFPSVEKEEDQDADIKHFEENFKVKVLHNKAAAEYSPALEIESISGKTLVKEDWEGIAEDNIVDSVYSSFGENRDEENSVFSSIYSSSDEDTTDNGDKSEARGNRNITSRFRMASLKETKEHRSVSDRERFMTQLMKSLKNNIFYNTYCYAMPKSKMVEQAYRHFVMDIQEMIDNLLDSNMGPSKGFPAESSEEKADRIVIDMRERYAAMVPGFSGILPSGEEEDCGKVSTESEPEQQKTRSGDVKNDKNPQSGQDSAEENKMKRMKIKESEEKDENEKDKQLELEVENDFPHNTIFVVSDLIRSLKASFPGQFLAHVNPIKNTLCVDMFEYIPFFSKEASENICLSKMNTSVCMELKDNMEAFEISREFRLEIPLGSISDIHICSEDSSEHPGLLVVKVTRGVLFYQRWVHSGFSFQNQWRRRENFLPFESFSCPPFFLVLGGITQEISDIASLIGRSDCHLKIDPNGDKPFFRDIIILPRRDEGRSATPDVGDSNTYLGFVDKMVTTRRNSLIDILVDHSLISDKDAKDLKLDIIQSDCSSVEPNLEKAYNYFDDIPVQSCLRDFVNFKCTSSLQLQEILSKCVSLKLKTPPAFFQAAEENSRHLTVTDVLLVENHFYSFCLDKLVPKNSFEHCSTCRTCTEPIAPPKVFTKLGEKSFICSNCGFKGRGTFVVIPQSTFNTDLKNYSGLVKNLNLREVVLDKPRFPDPCVGLERPDCPGLAFRMEDVTRDQLGLSDPLAFLLGSEARGMNSQGRFRQKYKKKEKTDPSLLPCSIQ